MAAELPLQSGKFIEAHLSARSMKPTRTLREDVLPWSEYSDIVWLGQPFVFNVGLGKFMFAK